MMIIKGLVLFSTCYELYVLLGKKEYLLWENRFLNQLNSTGVKLGFFDHLHRKIKFISGINDYMPMLNHYNFILICFMLFSGGWFYVMSKTHMIFLSFATGVLLSCIPFFLLECFVQRMNHLVSKEMVKFISLMTRWSYVKDDIYYCFGKMTEHLQNPLKRIIEEFLMTVKYSGDIIYGFDWLLIHSDNEMYRNLIINIKQAEYSQGDLPLLLERLEEEAYRIEGEHSRRISDTFLDRILIYGTIAFVLILGIVVLTMNETMKQYYLHTTSGQYLLSLYALLFLLGVYVASKITTFNY